MYKLNHITLNVKEPEKSAEFYLNLFKILGLYAEAKGIGENIMILSNEGTSIGLKKSEKSGSREGMDHFGFTTNNFADLELLTESLLKKEMFLEAKEHRDSSKSIFFNDLEGYRIQIVYMPPDLIK